MFKDNTVFVVGAGASADFGLPVGWELLQTIKANCKFERDSFGQVTGGPARIFEYFDEVFGRVEAKQMEKFFFRLKACEQIASGIDSADSIDEYIYRYTHDPIIAEVGKLQITYAISLAESRSTMGESFRQLPHSLDGTWIWAFTKALINGVKADQIDEIGQNITIICFNYDRCIEHYLEHALVRSFYGLTVEEARKIVGRINIIHPYGWLGSLQAFPFGETAHFGKMAENIITWSESVRDPEIVAKMRKSIKEARQIAFLGFGFATQNMELLNSQAAETPNYLPDVYSTGYGLMPEIEDALKANITALVSPVRLNNILNRIHFQYGEKCKPFFDIQRLNLVK